MEYISYGIILNSQDFKESDRIYNIFSREKGLIKVVAKSVSNSNSKLSGFLTSGNYCVFMFAEGKYIDRVAQVKVLKSFDFGYNYEFYKLFNQVAELLLNFLNENDKEQKLFDITLCFFEDLTRLDLEIDKKKLLQILYFSDIVKEFGFMPNWFNLKENINIFLENILKNDYFKNREAMLKLDMNDADLKIIKNWFKNYLESVLERKLNSF